MASDIYDFVFYEILKYDYSSSVLTGELQNDVIFGLLIPTIFIALVLYTMVHRVFGEAHKFIGYLSSITGLGVIVTLGWVPLIAGFGGFLFVALLAFYFINSFYRRVLPTGREKWMVDKAKKFGSDMRGKVDMAGYTMTKTELKKAESDLTGCFDRYANAHKTFKSANRGLESIRSQSTINTAGGGTGNDQSPSLNRQVDDARHEMDDIAEQAVDIVRSLPSYERDDIIERSAKHYKKDDVEGLVNRLKPWAKQE